jgi:hypothetical protein
VIRALVGAGPASECLSVIPQGELAMTIAGEDPLPIDGSLNYTNPPMFRYIDLGDTVEVAPLSPKQVRKLIGFCYATMTVTATLVTWLLWRFDDSTHRFVFAGLFWVGAAIFAGIFHAILGIEPRRGPWLVMNRVFKSLDLPRHRRVFPITKALRFEVAVGFNPRPEMERTHIAELHLRSITVDQEPAKSIAVVGAVDRGALQSIADSLNKKIVEWADAAAR